MEAGHIDETVMELLKGHDPVGSYRWEREHFQPRGGRDFESEKELMLELLTGAVGVYQKYIHARDRKGKILFKEAEEWILEENPDWLHSFENACESVGLNPSYVRKGLVKWKERALSERIHS